MTSETSDISLKDWVAGMAKERNETLSAIRIWVSQETCVTPNAVTHWESNRRKPSPPAKKLLIALMKENPLGSQAEQKEAVC